MKKLLFTSILGLILVGAGCFSSQPVNTTADNQTPTSQTPAENVPKENSPVETVKTFSLTDISAHLTSTDCWLAVEGKVYDVTSFIPNHPGGEKILLGCGKDATAMFNGIKDGKGHTQNARDIMQTLYIGDLKQ